ncbi:uncharacterized protein DUF2088 [Aliiruegeria haliotis]|uniref:Uncharacterized protein DUF2088 n=1 Tax=Aliiruegeria haliotis TaxID=1280846 RepID=A0A2T0RIJ0_9RHOB|nr:lactate racemase domain-containing protein [Aliiruegeria haliotis]PRY20969.1 uncharacterized protein DUF2088 [Aliiruegeria haliotis]
MQQVRLDYGEGHMQVELPDTATIVRYGETYQDPPCVDPYEATRKALDNPLGLPPLKDMAGPGKTAVIAFPDRVKGGAHATAHRKVSIPMIVEDLLAGGCRIEDITLICAMGLHRQNTLQEWYGYLGKKIVDQFWPDRLINHDAEGANLLELGNDEMGNIVQTNRIMAEADIPIMVGHCAGNPYGGYSGGYKMLVTGLAGWKSIASHHVPQTMHRKDWMGASPKSRMRDQFKSIGQTIEARIGKTFFEVDAVLGQHSQILDVKAGTLEEVEKATWPLAGKRTNVVLEDMAEPADVLVIGLPRDFHYGPGMGTNPILMNLAIAGQLSRCWNALRPGCVVIAAAQCDGWFNELWFPSYAETYQALQAYNTPREFLESEDAYTLSMDTGYRYRYSNDFTYHPFHAMSMISGGSAAHLWTSAIYLVGGRAPGFARGMGLQPRSTFEQAMAEAENYVGKNPKILCTPEAFSGGVGVHLHRNA